MRRERCAARYFVGGSSAESEASRWVISRLGELAWVRVPDSLEPVVDDALLGPRAEDREITPYQYAALEDGFMPQEAAHRGSHLVAFYCALHETAGCFG